LRRKLLWSRNGTLEDEGVHGKTKSYLGWEKARGKRGGVKGKWHKRTKNSGKLKKKIEVINKYTQKKNGKTAGQGVFTKSGWRKFTQGEKTRIVGCLRPEEENHSKGVATTF